MADNVAITAGAGTTIAADEVTDGTLGANIKVQYVKLMDGTIDGTVKAAVSAAGLKVDGTANVQPVSNAAGTFVTQENGAALTALQLLDDTIAAQGAALGSIKTSLNGGSVTTAAPTYTTGQVSPISLTTAGSMRVEIASTQLSLLQATFVPIATTNATQVCLATDQPVSNKVQTQTCGMTPSRINSAATANANFLKAAAGNVGNIDLFNMAATDAFVKFFNKASAPTLGTDTPVWTIPLKAGTGYSRTFQYGKYFSTGIAYAITKLQADTDATAIGAGEVTGAIDWI